MSVSSFYDEKFKQVIEDHLPLLIKDRYPQPIDASLQTSCKYNFYLLLNRMNVSYEYYWIFLRVNGYHSPQDYTGENTFIYMPDLKYIDRLMQVYLTKSGTIF